MSTLFSWLPSELLAMIYGYLDVSDTLSLEVLLDPDNETQHMHRFLTKHMPIPVLAAQQIIHQSGAQTNGSFDWAQYSGCKRALYDNPNYSSGFLFHEWEGIPQAIKYEDKELVLSVWAFVDTMLQCFKNCFEYSRDEFFLNRAHRPAHSTPNCFDKPTNVELMRMVLAVYQFNAYCRLLNKSRRDMSFDQAKSIAHQFFRNLTPWEKEQLYSVALTAEIVVPVNRIDRSNTLLHYEDDPMEPDDEPDVNGLPSALLKCEAMDYPYPDYYKLHLRTPAFTSTTVIWKEFIRGGTESQQSRKLMELKARLAPWSVALEKWSNIDYEYPHHPLLDMSETFRELADSFPEMWTRLIHLESDPDPVDQGPHRFWLSYLVGLGRGDGFSPGRRSLACHDYFRWLNVVGYTFWTSHRLVDSWLVQMRDRNGI